MKASEWIDRLKQQRGWESDYKAAQELGLSRATVSKYRVGATPTMDDEAALKVADALGTQPEIILIDQALERSKSDGAKEAFGKVLKRLGGVAAGVVMAGFVSAPSPAEAHQQPNQIATVHYVYKGKRRYKGKALAWIADQLRAALSQPALALA